MSAGAPHGFAQYRARGYFPALDGLRALSIAAVIWHHATPRPLPGALGRGHLGVQLFFAVSGFLITTLLLRERARTGAIDLRAFWLRRARRIFPLYYLVLAGFALAALALPTESPVRSHFFTNLPFFATHTANWFVSYRVAHPVLFGFAWSLSTEQQFYAFWPVLMRKLRGPALFGCLVTLIALDQFAERRWLSVFIPARSVWETIVTSFTASIALGALLAVLLDSPRGYRWLAPVLARPASAALAAVLVAAGVIWPPRAFLWFELGLALWVGACVLGSERRSVWPLETASLRHVGRVSYGMYLFHVPILGALRLLWPDLTSRPLPLFMLGFSITTLSATLSHSTFEAWFRTRRAPRAGRLAMGSSVEP